MQLAGDSQTGRTARSCPLMWLSGSLLVWTWVSWCRICDVLVDTDRALSAVCLGICKLLGYLFSCFCGTGFGGILV